MRLPLRFNSAARQFQKAFFVHHLSFVFLSMEDAAPVLGAAFSGSLGTLLRVRSHLWDVMCVLQTCCGDCDFRACQGRVLTHGFSPAFLSGTPPQSVLVWNCPSKAPPVYRATLALPRRHGPHRGPTRTTPARAAAGPPAQLFVSRNSRTVGGTCFSHSRVIAYSVSFSMVVSFLCRKQARASTWFAGTEVVICFFDIVNIG